MAVHAPLPTTLEWYFRVQSPFQINGERGAAEADIAGGGQDQGGDMESVFHGFSPEVDESIG
jgi:hypothetical protein